MALTFFGNRAIVKKTETYELVQYGKMSDTNHYFSVVLFMLVLLSFFSVDVMLIP